MDSQAIFGPLYTNAALYLFSNTQRPALHELIPQSDWNQWADAGDLPYVAIFTFYPGLRYQPKVCPLFLPCITGPEHSVGDTLLLPGSDDPFDVPLSGGAKFLPGETNNGQLWEWAPSISPHPIDPFSISDVSWALDHPAAHNTYGITSMT